MCWACPRTPSSNFPCAIEFNSHHPKPTGMSWLEITGIATQHCLGKPKEEEEEAVLGHALPLCLMEQLRFTHTSPQRNRVPKTCPESSAAYHVGFGLPQQANQHGNGLSEESFKTTALASTQVSRIDPCLPQWHHQSREPSAL